jgi:hypothetical protein
MKKEKVKLDNSKLLGFRLDKPGAKIGGGKIGSAKSGVTKT